MNGSNPALNLVVIRVRDLNRAREFYEAVGMCLRREQHGNGAEHFSADLGGVVFEIYPQGKSLPTTDTRLGFRVDSLNTALVALQQQGAFVASPTSVRPGDIFAVVVDPDGHRIELSQIAESTAPS